MKSRLVVALVVLVALTAFAPAPFPRTKRGEDADFNLAQFQGLWRAEKFETAWQGGRLSGHGWDSTQVRIENDRWTYLDNGRFGSAYQIRLDTSKSPVTIDFINVGSKTDESCMLGIIRRVHGKVEILFYLPGRGERPKTFDNPPPDWWILTLRRDK
jgi:uncharacterized protein (TIGR03067 family)